MTRSVVIATMWDHVQKVGAVDPAAPPSQADLDAIAVRLIPANCGVRPVVRVVEELHLPVFRIEDPGPVGEDMTYGWR